MENEERPSPGYLKGFNEGYALTKHSPELAQKIADSFGKLLENAPESDRASGFGDGRKQFYLDATKSRYPDWLKRDYSGLPEKSREPEKDINDLDKG